MGKNWQSRCGEDLNLALSKNADLLKAKLANLTEAPFATIPSVNSYPSRVVWMRLPLIGILRGISSDVQKMIGFETPAGNNSVLGQTFVTCRVAILTEFKLAQGNTVVSRVRSEAVTALK
jgi:hypothetical protein